MGKKKVLKDKAPQYLGKKKVVDFLQKASKLGHLCAS